LIPIQLYANVGVVGGMFDGRESVGRSAYDPKKEDSRSSKLKKSNKKEVQVTIVYQEKY
jgi:hypothetical protein